MTQLFFHNQEQRQAMTTTNYHLEILTPTHVGSGDSYMWLDYVYEAGLLYVLDIGRVSQALTRSGVISVGELVERMKDDNFSWNRLLQQAEVKPATLAEYAIPAAGDPAVGGSGRRGERSGEVRAIARNANQQPYIPGSSIKGAIRSAVVNRLLPAMSNNELGGMVGRGRKEFASGQIEQTLLGRDPNHDLFRALQVSDSDPFALDAVRVVEVRRGRNFDGSGGMLSFVEVLRPSAATVVKLRLDDGLLEQHARTLGWSDKQVAILRDELAVACREFSTLVLAEQRKFYRQMWQESEDAGSFSLLLGWGGGWAGKAPVGLRLREEMPGFFEQTANYLQMGKRDVEINADTFPTSHWMVQEGSQEMPLGWVRLTPTEAQPTLPRLQPTQVAEVAVKALPPVALAQRPLPPRGGGGYQSPLSRPMQSVPDVPEPPITASRVPAAPRSITQVDQLEVGKEYRAVVRKVLADEMELVVEEIARIYGTVRKNTGASYKSMGYKPGSKVKARVLKLRPLTLELVEGKR